MLFQKDEQGQTPLHWAAAKDRASVRLLLSLGALHFKDQQGKTPIDIAATPEIEKILLLFLCPIVELKHPFLFSIEKHGKISYLLGTQHNLSLEGLPQPCLELLKSAKTIVTEFSLHRLTIEKALEFFPLSKPASLNLLYPWSKPASLNWLEDLPDPIRDYIDLAVDRVTASFGLKGLAAHLTPGAVSILLSWRGNYGGMDDGLLHSFPMSQRFSLDNPSGDLEYGLVWPEKEWGTLLQGTVYELISKVMRDLDLPFILNPQYQPGNLKGIELFSGTPMAMLNSPSNKARNINWLPDIMHYHLTQKSPALFVWGAYHLVGPTGQLQLLANEGCKIKRIDALGQGHEFPLEPIAPALVSKPWITPGYDKFKQEKEGKIAQHKVEVDNPAHGSPEALAKPAARKIPSKL